MIYKKEENINVAMLANSSHIFSYNFRISEDDSQRLAKHENNIKNRLFLS